MDSHSFHIIQVLADALRNAALATEYSRAAYNNIINDFFSLLSIGFNFQKNINSYIFPSMYDKTTRVAVAVFIFFFFFRFVW